MDTNTSMSITGLVFTFASPLIIFLSSYHLFLLFASPMVKSKWFLWRMRLESTYHPDVVWLSSKGKFFSFIKKLQCFKYFVVYTDDESNSCKKHIMDTIMYLKVGDVSPLYVVQCYNHSIQYKLQRWKLAVIEKLLDKITDTKFQYPTSNKDIQSFIRSNNNGRDDYENSIYCHIRNKLGIDIENTIASEYFDSSMNMATSTLSIYDSSFNLVEEIVGKND